MIAQGYIMKGEEQDPGSQRIYIFGFSTLIAVVFFAQAYVTAFNARQEFNWAEQAVYAATFWYLFALFFPCLLSLSRRLPLRGEHKIRNAAIHIFAGAAFAIAHIQVQAVLNGLLLRGTFEWTEPGRLVTLFFWRFFVYMGIFTISIALDWYSKARQANLESSQIETAILQTQIESLKMQIDPEFLFNSLHRLSHLMRSDLGEADTLVARLGDYLRATLEGSGDSEATLRQELDFLNCYMEVENARDSSHRVSLDLDVDPAALSWTVPALVLVAPVQDAIRQGARGSIRISAMAAVAALNLRIQYRAESNDTLDQEKLKQLVEGWNSLYSTPLRISEAVEGKTRIKEIQVPALLQKGQPVQHMAPEAPSGSPSSIPEPALQVLNPVRKWLVIISIFTVLPIYFTVQNVLVNASRGTAMNWPVQLLNMSGWYVWALFTPFILRFSERFPLQREGLARRLVLHFSAFVASWVAASLAMGFTRWAANLGDYSFFGALPETFARSPFGLDILCYSTIVAVETALRYSRKYLYGTLRTARLTADLAHARLQALKMQLHPHFLFNALNSLSELMEEDPDTAEEMISNLETFLHLTLSRPQVQEIPFEEELEFLKCYLAIEEIRFQNRLRVLMNIEPQAMNVAFPNMVLQPIVENAIKHGVAPRKSDGEIEILARTENGMLTVSVRDNGPGISVRRSKGSSRSGVGLSNTRERLNHLYGNAHRFELKSGPEGGLVVTMEIPAVSAFAPVN